MIHQEGVRSLWKGLGPTLWRDVPFSGLYWAGFESLKIRFRKQGVEGTTGTFLSGAISGTLAAFLTSPFDVLKTRRQALSGETVKATLPLIREVIRNEGVRALYAGLTPRMAKIAPACGIMISCYEVRLTVIEATENEIDLGYSCRASRGTSISGQSIEEPSAPDDKTY